MDISILSRPIKGAKRTFFVEEVRGDAEGIPTVVMQASGSALLVIASLIEGVPDVASTKKPAFMLTSGTYSA